MSIGVSSIKMFVAGEISVLKELFDYVIPAGSNNVMPRASFLFDYNAIFSSSDVLVLKMVLSLVSDYSVSQYGKEYVELSITDKQLIMKTLKQKSNRKFNELAFIIMRHYYTNDIILEAIGVKSRPPFPEGNSIPEGDMLLFESVYEKGKIFRD